MSTLLYCLSLTAVALAFYYLGRANGSYHRDALNLEIGLLRAQRDEAMRGMFSGESRADGWKRIKKSIASVDEVPNWGKVTAPDHGDPADWHCHDDSHTLRPPKEEKNG